MWKCPKCASTDLGVVVTTFAKLTQYDDDTFQTEPGHDHEWDGQSLMTCVDCGHCDVSDAFVTQHVPA